MKLRRPVLLSSAVLLGACALHDVQHDDPPVEPAKPATAARTPALSAPERHVVKPGDTLYGIAWAQGVDYKELAAWNHIRAPFTIYPGQTIYLKPGLAPEPVPATRRVTAAQGEAQPPPPVAEPGSLPSPGRYQTRSQDADAAGAAEAATAPAQTAPREAAKTDSAPKPVPPPAPRDPPSAPARSAAGDLLWRWPTAGTVTSNFASGDSSRQGIDIRGREGQEVVAAAGGEVVYSGNGLIGYGELIIIKHDETWLSAYGNNRERQVNEGTQVSAGQVIARMGAANGEPAELHFEIRRKGKPVDPLRYLPDR